MTRSHITIDRGETMFGGATDRSSGGGGAWRVLAASALLALALLLAGAASARAQDPAPVKVLLFHGTPGDETTQPGIDAFEAIAAGNGFTVDATGDATQISAEGLEPYRAVVFLNTAGDLLDDEQEGALEAFIEDGGGFLGIGSAAQSEIGTEFFDGLIGARPSAASSTTPSVQRVVAGDRVHPATKDLPLETDRTDVWYQWQTRPTGSVHTVARYHATNAPAGDGTNAGGTDTPISWCRDYEGGRSFYTGMGRTAGSFAEEGFRDHLLGAVRWTAGLVRANCKATINSSYKATKIVTAGAEELGLRNTGESHGLVTAPNGWVLYIGRGDCRTDAERGELLGLPTLGRVFNHANPNVGIGCGSVHIYDPAAATDGTLNSGVTEAGKLAVYGDGGQGGERTDQGDHKMEYGLLGITVAPDFDTTGHIYLQYFPSFNPASKPAGLPLERRVSKMSRPRISRFTIDLDTKQLDLDSEVRIFEYDAQIYSCCHVGGGMGFDSEGNLYVTTGDTNSSQGSDGYSGNNPVAKCPTGPDNQPSSTHCGTANYSYQDARRTAGNTNDYNGKMLRFRPLPDIPDGEQPAVGVGTTYALPTEGSPNGPNLFSGTEGNGNQAKPEIYAMGLRNPSRLYVDPVTDVPYSAWVGPDAGAPSTTLGPSTYENAAQIDRAGNYGWPYCMGNAQAYRDRYRQRATAHRQPRGLRAGRPRDRRDRRLVRLRQPPQRLAEQHRPGRAPARHRNRHGRGEGAPGEPLVQPRQSRLRQRLPELSAGPRRDRGAELRRHADPAVPVPAGRGHDRDGRPGVPLRRGRGRRQPALARVLGRPLVPAQQRRGEREARAAVRPGHRRGRRPARLRRQPA